MPKQKEKSKCDKCGIEHYCDEHHVLPKGIFGSGATVFLCKNCHYEYHRFLGFKYLRKTNKQPAEFYLKKFAIWISMLLAIGILVLLW